ELVTLAQKSKVIAIGETGLDYYRLDGRTIEQMAWQRDRFRTHIASAKRVGKPLIIHTRAAHEDTLAIMRQEDAAQAGGIMHCFTESMDVAKAALDLGFYISFSGIITFKSAQDLREVVKMVPLDRILIETDAPYLAPMPYRGKTNEPAYVHYVGKLVADLKGLTPLTMAQKVPHNIVSKVELNDEQMDKMAPDLYREIQFD
ncbi:unnamed protein product, partial [Darwinula stevensoni]